MLQNHCGIHTSICADKLAATGVTATFSCLCTLVRGGNDRARRSRTCPGPRVRGQSFINRPKTHLDTHMWTCVCVCVYRGSCLSASPGRSQAPLGATIRQSVSHMVSHRVTKHKLQLCEVLYHRRRGHKHQSRGSK